MVGQTSAIFLRRSQKAMIDGTGREMRCTNDRRRLGANGGTETEVMKSWLSRCVCSSEREGCWEATEGSKERIRRSTRWGIAVGAITW